MEPLKAVEADAATTDGATVTLTSEAGEFSVMVPPPGRWRTRANRALRQGDFDEWAELVLSAEDYASWVEADPTNDDVSRFFEAWGEATGENRGKSRRSTSSSRSTAKR